MRYSLKTPVLLNAFNRPDLTQKVFDKIREVKPIKLYFAVDGPRQNIASESDLCKKTRDIIKQIDWDCKLHTNFRDRNSGCKSAVSSNIDWFFKNEEKGIILEDDTLPHVTFFRFCEELLERYKDDERIMMVSGDNFQFGKKYTEYSYYFSRYAHVWGWASWRRAWKYYDIDMKLWPKVRDGGLLSNILGGKGRVVSYWSNTFEKVYKGGINTWDYQWLFACWMQNGLAILPEVNLISNIGFGHSSVHTRSKGMLANLESEDVVFPLVHPPYMVRSMAADKFIEKCQFGSQRLYKKLVNLIYAH